MRGVCSMTAEDSVEAVLERAKLFESKKTFGVYDILENNCMHFAYYCKTGKIKGGKSGRAVGVLEVEGSIVKKVGEKSLVLLLLNGCHRLASCFMDQEEIFKEDNQVESSISKDSSSGLWTLLCFIKLQSKSRPLLLSTDQES